MGSTTRPQLGFPRGMVAQTMLGRAATLEDVGNMAAFVASDRARTMTGATANVSCGALVD
jgi:3-oxoacyl-[acyl-carrier protein] reductase